MTHILASDAPRFQIPGAEFIGLAAPSRGAKETAVWRLRLSPGSAPTVHRLTREEVFVALAGAARATLAGKSFDLTAGAALIVPPDTDFALEAVGEEPFEAVVAMPVGGMARFAEGAAFTPPWAA